MIEITGYKAPLMGEPYKMNLSPDFITGHKVSHWTNTGSWVEVSRHATPKGWLLSYKEIDTLFGYALRHATEVKIDGAHVDRDKAVTYILDLMRNVGRNDDVQKLKKLNYIWEER